MERNTEMAVRLWALSTRLRSREELTLEEMNQFGEICDDIAIVLAKTDDREYDEELHNAQDVESLTPTYKFSRATE